MRAVFPTLLLIGLFAAARLPAALTFGLPDSPGDPAITADADNPAMAAVDAFNEGRHIEATRLAGPLAEAGNAEALLILGIAHEAGPSPDKAIDFLRKAHQAGSQVASYRLLRLLVAQREPGGQQEARKMLEELAKHDRGAAARHLGDGFLRGWFGGEPDFEQTRHWWGQAAKQGDVASMTLLGGLLDGSFGFPAKRDPAAALEWFLQAARLENPNAMASAGSRLLNGEEQIRDEQAGRKWLAKAIARGQADAWLALGDFEEMTRKDELAAFEQYRKGAEAGQSGCMLKLAEFLAAGRAGQEKNTEQALAWLNKAGDAGNPLGHYRAAGILLDGEKPEVFEGLTQLVLAAAADLAMAQRELGLLYLSGRLGFRDPIAAAGWFQRAAAGGDTDGTYRLGSLYEQGIGVPWNPVEAGRLYARAANASHPQATSALGRLHARGDGTKQDLPKAWALISLAIKRGDNLAREPLDELTSQLTETQITEGRRLLAEFEKNPL